MLLIDAHLDLSMNALEWNRDLRSSITEINSREEGMTDKLDRGKATVSLEELRKGVVLIYQKFYNTLEQKGLSKIETVQGDMFDAEIHEAITQIPAPSEDLKGKIIDVIEQGYKLGDKIIRYPKVVIGQ